MSNQVSEIEEKRVWGIHTKDDNLFLKENVIALGWQQIGDLSLIAPDREACKEGIDSHRCRHAVSVLP